MTDDNKIALSRRKVLGSLSAIGVASAGAGLGTSAYFSDDEPITNNTVRAGKLNLKVDYATDSHQGSAGTTTNTGFIDGNPGSYSYVITDVKPGDTGTLAFCPKLINNTGWLWVGSEDGVTDAENGRTDPEKEVDDTSGQGELSEAIQVDLSYCEDVSIDGDEVTATTLRELNNPSDYTLADLALDLRKGFRLDGQDVSDGTTDPYPASSDRNDQQGPCLCIEWELPTDVGNEVQTDSARLDFQFVALQNRHNASPDNPFPSSFDATLTSPATGGIRESDNWITAKISTGRFTVFRIDLDGEVYGGGNSGLGEWPSNPNSYVMEVNVDHDVDGLGGNDSATDDFRIGWAGPNTAERPGSNSAGGYIKRNPPNGSRFVTIEENLSGFTAFESADQLTYCFVIDWESDLPDPEVGTPNAIVVNEVFGGDGGEGVGVPNSSNDGREDVTTVTGSSGTLTF